MQGTACYSMNTNTAESEIDMSRMDHKACQTSGGLLGLAGLPNSLLSVLYACQQVAYNSQFNH